MGGILERAKDATMQLKETALRERAGDAKMTSLVLRTFLRAAALQRTLSLKTLVASHIEFEVSAMPWARLYFEHAN